MSTDALPEQAQAAQATAAGEPTPQVAPEATPDVAQRDTNPEPAASPAPVAGPEGAVAPTPEQAATPEQDDDPERADNIETRTAARLHQLVASGAEKLPGEAGSTVSKLAVALLSFGSQAAAKDQEKSTSALVGEAVGLFKSLDDDDPSKQRNALEHALETFTTSTIGGKERSQVLEVAEEAMGLWSKLRGTSSDLAKSDAAASMRSLTSALRKEGRDEEADEAETEAKRLES
ncbi:hypothetical protein [Promicromonospora sp. NPDC057488]|uniref:hypothetical protein n=1 Tax=Promicromonospora sp. NPDC057488 TaxID=3346147 RepID=UPI00366F350C